MPEIDPIPDRVRAQLLTLEIPAAIHAPEALTGLFPCEFNIAATGLNADNVDVYFDRGQLEILSPSSGYLDPVGRLEPFERIAEALLTKQDQALTRGFKFLRAAADTGWVGPSRAKASSTMR